MHKNINLSIACIAFKNIDLTTISLTSLRYHSNEKSVYFFPTSLNSHYNDLRIGLI